MTDHKRALALGDALRAMFQRLEQRETPPTLKATVEQLDASARAEASPPVPEPPPESDDQA